MRSLHDVTKSGYNFKSKLVIRLLASLGLLFPFDVEEHLDSQEQVEINCSFFSLSTWLSL